MSWSEVVNSIRTLEDSGVISAEEASEAIFECECIEEDEKETELFYKH